MMLQHAATWLAVSFALFAMLLWISSASLYELTEPTEALTVHMSDEQKAQVNRFIGHTFGLAGVAGIFALLSRF